MEDKEFTRQSQRKNLLSTFTAGIAGIVIGALLILTVIPGANLSSRSSPDMAQAATVENVPAFLDENAITNVAAKAGPAVVGISTTMVGYDAFLQPVPSQGVGSGFIFDKRGYILTNDHVIQGASKITVTLADGRSLPGQLIGSDPTTDLAVVKINASNLPVEELGDSSKIKVGQLAIAIGNPLGLELQRTVTAGIISAVSRTVEGEDGSVHENLLQTDASINPGNSGGPLLNSHGQVVGINSAKISGAEGIGFAIPINTAKPIAEEIIAHGRITHPWLGISGADIDQQVANYYNLPVSKGVIVAQVVQGGPADMAGIQPGDIITAVDGQAVNTMQNLKNIIQAKKPGQSITVSLISGTSRYKAKVILGTAPAE